MGAELPILEAVTVAVCEHIPVLDGEERPMVAAWLVAIGMAEDDVPLGSVVAADVAPGLLGPLPAS